MKLQLKDIKKGQIFWDKWAQCESLEDAHESGVTDLPGRPVCKQWSMKGKVIEDGTIINFLVTEGAEHYGPRLDTENMYERVTDAGTNGAQEQLTDSYKEYYKKCEDILEWLEEDKQHN